MTRVGPPAGAAPDAAPRLLRPPRPGRTRGPRLRRPLRGGCSPAGARRLRAPVAVVAAVPGRRLDDAARPGRGPGARAPTSTSRSPTGSSRPASTSGQAGRAAGLTVGADAVRRHRQHRPRRSMTSARQPTSPRSSRPPAADTVARHHPGPQRRQQLDQPVRHDPVRRASACRASRRAARGRRAPTRRTSRCRLIGITDPADRRRPCPPSSSARRSSCPSAGSYDLYFVFPMQREQATLDLITRTFPIGGLALVLLVGAIA